MSFWKKLFGNKKKDTPSPEVKDTPSLEVKDTPSLEETYSRQIAEILAMSELVATDELDKAEMDKRVAAMKQLNIMGPDSKYDKQLKAETYFKTKASLETRTDAKGRKALRVLEGKIANDQLIDLMYEATKNDDDKYYDLLGVLFRIREERRERIRGELDSGQIKAKVSAQLQEIVTKALMPKDMRE